MADRGALGRPNHLDGGGLGCLRGLWDRGPHLNGGRRPLEPLSPRSLLPASSSPTSSNDVPHRCCACGRGSAPAGSTTRGGRSVARPRSNARGSVAPSLREAVGHLAATRRGCEDRRESLDPSRMRLVATHRWSTSSETSHCRRRAVVFGADLLSRAIPLEPTGPRFEHAWRVLRPRAALIETRSSPAASSPPHSTSVPSLLPPPSHDIELTVDLSNDA